ncbi:MAG: DNA translocase FtsK [Muribaculaceae bacterium]|nr:DNA translocase FtsK [Muribaculaceae bacterium]
MAKYDTFNPEIENGYESSSDSLTYPDTDHEHIDGVGTRNSKSGRNIRPGSASAGKNTKRKTKTLRKPKRPAVSVKEKINIFMDDNRTRNVIGFALLAFSAYLIIAFISYIVNGLHDQSEVQNVASGAATEIKNVAGEGGARLSDLLINQSFGLASGVIILWTLGLAMRFFGVFRFKVVNFTIKCLVALITTSLIIGLGTIAFDSHYLWGGAHGYVINERIIHYIGWIGAVLLCAVLIVLFFSICLYDIYKYFKGIALRRRQEREKQEEKERKREELERKIAELQALEDEKIAEEKNPETGEPVPTQELDFSNDDYTDTADEDTSEQDNAQDIDKALEEGVLPEDNKLDTVSEEDKPKMDGKPVEIETPSGVMKVTTNEIGKAVSDNDTPDVFDPTATLSNYKFPPYSLLRESVSRISVDQNEQLENQERIRTTLADFGIEITEIKATVGPTVTLYEIRPDKGVKISKIRSLGDDIALSLAAVGVRIIAPIPGRGTVGIEVANKDPQTVSMRTIIQSRAYQECRYELPIAIGSTINNHVYLADLAKMPHLLVAGATGQGKSVGLNAIIASLLYRKHPAELKFVLVDPKMVEFSLYQALENHYLAQLPGEEEAVITRPEKVVATLSSLCVEMDARYDLLKAAEVRNIKEYNAKFIERRLNPDKGHRFMPYIVVIVDEFADLIMTAGKEVETPIARLAQKARAIGIHVILATQRPSANVITGVIKANFPARIAFKVASGIDSRTVLDATGAEHLIGRGDMLISNNSEMERVQCAFIDTPEVTAICQHIKAQQSYGSPYLLPEPLPMGDGGGATGAGGGEYGDRDPLFDEIARLIVTSNTASTSSLQRRYSIGYNRAGKIMDQMEAAGIVGPASGGKPRQVLVDSIMLESILSSL